MRLDETTMAPRVRTGMAERERRRRRRRPSRRGEIEEAAPYQASRYLFPPCKTMRRL